MVWHSRRLNQGNELRAKLSHTFLQGLLHSAVGTWGKETSVVNSCSILKEVFKAVDLGNKLKHVQIAAVLELVLFAKGAEQVELQVFQVGHCHVVLGLVEHLIVLHLGGQLRLVVVLHRRLDQVASAHLHSLVQQVQVKEVLDGASGVFGGQCLLHTADVLKGEGELLAFAGALNLLDEIAGGLSEHDRVLTLVSGDW